VATAGGQGARMHTCKVMGRGKCFARAGEASEERVSICMWNLYIMFWCLFC
jgi:hypothetical protein